MIAYVRRVRSFRREAMAAHPRALRLHRLLTAACAVAWVVLIVLSHQAHAQQVPAIPPAVPTGNTTAVTSPASPGITVPTPGQGVTATTVAPTASAGISVDLGNGAAPPTRSVLIILVVTLLSVAPSLIIMTTAFTRIVVVLSLVRNALGLQAIPPNQVVVGLALFLSLFVMAPTLSKMNDVGLQPLLKGQISAGEAYNAATVPLKDFMLANTRTAELDMMVSVSGKPRPATPQATSLTLVIPAFILSELKTAFIIGFVIFVPFLVIDLVVSAVLMSLGMMMLPPAFVSLPFKILLFVLVDGWSLVAETLIRSFH